jgi:hypothetical protein
LDRASPFSIGRREYRLKGWFAAIYLLLGSIELPNGAAPLSGKSRFTAIIGNIACSCRFYPSDRGGKL